MELLVTVGIILVLFSLGFWMLGGLRVMQENAKCTHNLRQIGGAMALYITDHNGGVPPRNLGVLRSTLVPPQAQPPSNLRAWHARFLNLGYLQTPDVLFCPSMFPKTYKEARRNPATATAAETYGMRIWGIPGRAWDQHREEHKPITVVKTPADFFIIADSLWTAEGWQSQGYGLAPGASDQLVHLRHNARANALFLDGHVEAKPGSYFETLHHEDRQKEYSDARPFSTIEKLPF